MAYRVLETIERLQNAKNSQDVLGVLDQNIQVQNTGCEFFMLNFLPQPSQRFEDMNLAHQVPRTWLDRVVERKLFQVDAALRHCQSTISPFKWIDAPFHPEKEPEYSELVELTQDFQIADGLMVPITSSNGTIGNFWAGGYQAKDLERFSPIFQLIGHAAFYRLHALTGPKNSKVALTERETEILKWAANGKTAWEIGVILSISKRTVEWHFKQAEKKLGTTNRLQTVAFALTHSLIAI
jgi:LuxR family quorum sensing-dependent transcriptional regulator